MRVLVCDPIHPSGLDLLMRRGLQVDYEPMISGEELLERVADYDCLIVRSRTRITGEVLRRAKRLRLVARAGSGVDNIDLEEAARRGVKVVRVPEAVADSVAELTIGLLLILARRLHGILSNRGRESREGMELRGKTLGVVGFGCIGSRVAAIGRTLGMKILINDVRKISEKVLEGLDAESVCLEELLSLSDFVTLHIPLTEKNYGLLGEEELRIMRNTAYLINTSRPDIVDSQALYRALREGWIAGAAFDADDDWVGRNEKLLELENFIVTPHIGAKTSEAYQRVSEEVARRVAETLTLKPLP